MWMQPAQSQSSQCERTFILISDCSNSLNINGPKIYLNEGEHFLKANIQLGRS